MHSQCALSEPISSSRKMRKFTVCRFIQIYLTKKHDGKKSGTSSKKASGIVIFSNKQKRQLSDSDEASSVPSTAKNVKYFLEESTEESSDSRWMSIKNLRKRGSDHGFKKRKSAFELNGRSLVDKQKRKLSIHELVVDF